MSLIDQILHPTNANKTGRQREKQSLKEVEVEAAARLERGGGQRENDLIPCE
jgi:hypothetical protein